jgi:hypothetical protein
MLSKIKHERTSFSSLSQAQHRNEFSKSKFILPENAHSDNQHAIKPDMEMEKPGGKPEEKSESSIHFSSMNSNDVGSMNQVRDSILFSKTHQPGMSI